MGGLQNWTGHFAKGMTAKEVASSFLVSEEYKNTFDGLNNEDFVKKLYENGLHRTAEADGLNNFKTKLDDQQLSRAEVAVAIAMSEESLRENTSPMENYVKTSAGGNDYLQAEGTGNHLWGGFGADTFEFDANNTSVSVVHDLESWDSVQVLNHNITSTSELKSYLTQSGDDAVLNYNGVKVTFEKATIDDVVDVFVI